MTRPLDQGWLAGTGAPNDPALGQWDTPPEVAAAVAAEEHVTGCRVIEPSAGTGNLVRAALVAGAAFVLAMEIDPVRCETMRRRFRAEIERGAVRVVEADFLHAGSVECPELFDAIVANPPYDRGADTDHLARIADVLHEMAWGAWARVLARTVVLHGKKRAARVWNRVRPVAIEPYSERVAFGEKAGQIDVSIFTLTPLVNPRSPAAGPGGVQVGTLADVRWR